MENTGKRCNQWVSPALKSDKDTAIGYRRLWTFLYWSIRSLRTESWLEVRIKPAISRIHVSHGRWDTPCPAETPFRCCWACLPEELSQRSSRPADWQCNRTCDSWSFRRRCIGRSLCSSRENTLRSCTTETWHTLWTETPPSISHRKIWQTICNNNWCQQKSSQSTDRD